MALLSTLRAATRDAHRMLDHHPLLSPLIRPGLTIDSYARCLSSIYAVQNALEQAVTAPPWRAWLPLRSSALLQDLAQLRCSALPLRVDRSVPSVLSWIPQLGLVYVLAGSLKGAQVIANCLQQHLPSQAPMRFFSAAPQPEVWTNLVAALERVPEAEHDSILQASLAAFAMYQHHLDDCVRQWKVRSTLKEELDGARNPLRTPDQVLPVVQG